MACAGCNQKHPFGKLRPTPTSPTPPNPLAQRAIITRPQPVRGVIKNSNRLPKE